MYLPYFCRYTGLCLYCTYMYKVYVNRPYDIVHVRNCPSGYGLNGEHLKSETFLNLTLSLLYFKAQFAIVLLFRLRLYEENVLMSINYLSIIPLPTEPTERIC